MYVIVAAIKYLYKLHRFTAGDVIALFVQSRTSRICDFTFEIADGTYGAVVFQWFRLLPRDWG